MKTIHLTINLSDDEAEVLRDFCQQLRVSVDTLAERELKSVLSIRRANVARHGKTGRPELTA